MRILSIDPGETSAFVIGQIRPALGSVHSLCVTSWGAWSGLEELALLAENKLFKGLDAIVIENYRGEFAINNLLRCSCGIASLCCWAGKVNIA